MVFKKMSKLSASTLSIVEVGNITSMTTGDVMSISAMAFFINTIVSVPILIIAITIILTNEFGLISLVTPVVFLTLTVIQRFVSLYNVKNVFQPRAKINDRMGSYINEMIKGMRSIKFYGWEFNSLEKIMEYRKAAMNLNFVGYTLNSFMSYLSPMFPVLTTLIIIWYI